MIATEWKNQDGQIGKQATGYGEASNIVNSQVGMNYAIANVEKRF